MDKKFVSVFPNNVKTYLQNSIFDIQKNKSTESPIYAKIRNLLKERNIAMNTYDISTGTPSYRNIHLDLPYPIPSNFHLWKTIFLNRKKNILICLEPPVVVPFTYMKIFHIFFIKIYTAYDDLVDNKKYFKIRFPKLNLGINTKAKKFKEKKFLVLINSNKSPFFLFKALSPFGKELYSERIKSIEFFEHNIPKDFYLYGRGWNKKKKFNLSETIFGYKKYSTYKGEIDDKIKLLSGFKYSICFENIADVSGYITEKLFDCFKAKCVPIYWGASNIEKYIPKDCFIDFRDFLDYEKLLDYLVSINESKYNKYIENIERLLADKKFIALWFEDGYANFFLNDVLEIQ